jgi:hypothetical protein
MKVRYLAIAVVIALCSGISHADSLDTFVLTGPVYTWTWTIPASPGDTRAAPGILGYTGWTVFTAGPPCPDPSTFAPCYGVGRATSHDIYWESPFWLQLTCNSSCNQHADPLFTQAVYSGTALDATFLLGNYVSTDGTETLSITAVPEGPELPMLGITALGILGAMTKKFLVGSSNL